MSEVYNKLEKLSTSNPDKIFFCLSFLCIPYAESLLYRNSECSVIITSNDQIQKYFSFVHPELNVINIGNKSVSLGFTYFRRFLTIQLEKYKYRKLLNSIKGANIFFFHLNFGYFEQWMIYILSGENKIYYQPDSKPGPRVSNLSLRDYLRKLSIYLLYGLPTEVHSSPIGHVFNVSDIYLKRVGAFVHRNQGPKNLGDLSSMILKKLEIKRAEFLLLSGDSVKENFINQNEFISKNDSLVTLLSQQRTHLKLHPKYNQCYGLEVTLQRVPDFIPANLIVKGYRCVFSYISSTLYEAANMGIMAICLVNYFEATSESLKEQGRMFLENNLNEGKRIYYPSSLEEIKLLLQSNKLLEY